MSTLVLVPLFCLGLLQIMDDNKIYVILYCKKEAKQED